jgi:hypothetical protein
MRGNVGDLCGMKKSAVRRTLAFYRQPRTQLGIHAFLILPQLPADSSTLARLFPTVSMNCIATPGPPSQEAGPSRPGAPFSATYRTNLLADIVTLSEQPYSHACKPSFHRVLSPLTPPQMPTTLHPLPTHKHPHCTMASSKSES